MFCQVKINNQLYKHTSYIHNLNKPHTWVHLNQHQSVDVRTQGTNQSGCDVAWSPPEADSLFREGCLDKIL